MIEHIAASVETTSPGAGIHAPLIDTGPMAGAIWILSALGSAVWWSTVVGGKTRAYRLFVLHATLSKLSTGRGYTGIFIDYWWVPNRLGRRQGLAAHEGITCITRMTRAISSVLMRSTNGVLTTCTRARIGAPSAHAGFIIGTFGISGALGSTSRWGTIVVG